MRLGTSLVSLTFAALVAGSALPAFGAPTSCRLTGDAMDSFYCALNDQAVHARLALSLAQESAWHRLKDAYDARRADSGESLHQREQAFIAGLSKDQHEVLEAEMRTREQALADLQQKLILHRLML